MGILTKIARAAEDSVDTMASAAMNAVKYTSDEVRGTTAVTSGKVKDMMAPKYLNGMAGVVDHLIAHDTNRLFLADAIAGAEAEAVRSEAVDGVEVSWDAILLAALLELKTTKVCKR